jgi:intracellular septation protein A
MTVDNPNRRTLRARLRPLVGPALDLGAPVAAYYLLLAAGVGSVTALVVSAVLPLLTVAYQVARHRRLPKASLFALVMVVVGVVAALWTGSVRLVFAKEALFTAAVGLWFLASVRSRRPAALVLSEPLLRWVTSPDVSWPVLWRDEPRFRRIWRTTTLMQGVGLILDALVRAYIAYALPEAAVPAATTALYPVFIVLLLAVTNVYQHRAGLFVMLRPWEARIRRRATS